MMRITDLGGHSGCKILLCENDDNTVFVRKISSGRGYNERLKIQEEKQVNFLGQSIKTPKILSRGITEEGLYYFDMEYISGITLSEYMKSVEVGKVRYLVQAIVKTIVPVQSLTDAADEAMFVEKISILESKLLSHNNNVINQAIFMLRNHSWKRFGVSACHGDLTLENIIVKDNELYLIDFLDSFYDCWILDVGTLLQDVLTLWSYRFEEEININTVIRLIVFRDILMDTVRLISPDDCIEVYYSLLLKLIRIFPYTKDKKTYEFLLDKVVLIMHTINQEEK